MDGIFAELTVICCAAMDVHEPRANTGALSVDDLTAAEATCFEHLAIVFDKAILDQYVTVRNQMIPHNKFRIDNRKQKVFKSSYC